jgi:Flp pilus assembly protein TadD
MSIRRIVPLDQVQWAVAPAPAWRLSRDIDWSFRAPSEESVVWLLIDEQHHVATQAAARRWVRQLLSIGAVQALSQVELEFEPDSQRLVVHELVVWRLDADGVWRKRTPVARDAFLLRQREQQLEQQMLNGRVSLVALLEDVRVGDAVELAWTVEPRDRLPGFAFTTYFGFAWRAHVSEAFFTLHLAADTPVRWTLHPGGDGPLPEERQTQGLVEWSLQAVPRFDGEGNVPGSHWHWPLLEVTGWCSWQEVAGTVAGLWSEALASDAELVAAEAARLMQGQSPEQSILSAIRFVQEDVRYLAVDFGHGAGMLPSGAGTVLQRRFGDCKDKTVLLTALLRALGVDARPVLVASQWREAVARLAPSASAFDHAIVGFDWNGARYFVDPTLIGQRGDLAHRVPPPYAVGLELAATTTALVEVTPVPPATLTVTECFRLDRRGKGQVEQTLHVTGSFADDVRATLLREGRQAFARTRAESLQQRFPALELNIDTTRFDDDVEHNTLQMCADHTLPTWGKAGDKPPPTFGYGAYGLLLGLDVVEDSDQRRQPWALRHPMTLQHRVVVRGRCVRRAKPSHFEHSGPGFRFRSEVASKRHEVTFDYVWETLAPSVAAQDWPDYRRAREVALQRTGALVNTQGMTWAGALRVGLVGLLGLMWGGQVIYRMSNHTSAPLDAISQASGDRKVSEAFAAMGQGDAARAYELIAPLERFYDANFDVQILLGESAMRTGHGAQATHALARARQLRPGSPAPDIVEANMLELNGDFAGARRRLEAVVAQSGAPDKAFADLARVAQRMGDVWAARVAWEQLLVRQPMQPGALFGLAHLLWLGGEHERADALIENAVGKQSAPSAPLVAMQARYFSVTARPQQALEAARRAASLAPQDPLIAYQLVMAQVSAGAQVEAVATAEATTRSFPDSGLAWAALATSGAVAQRHDLAGPAFERWLELAPGDPNAAANFGYFLHVTGNNARARDVLAAGIKRFPGYGTLWLNYGLALEALNDPAAVEAKRKGAALSTPEEQALLIR